MRRLFSLIRFALVVGLVVWLMMQPGTASIVWRDYVIETSASALILAALAVVFILFNLFRFWRFIMDTPRLWRLNQKIRKAEKAQDHIARGLIALAAGDGAEAGRLAVTARKLSNHSTSSRLLQAQAAQLTGDKRAAHLLFSELATQNETAVFGYRGLIMDAMKDKKWDEAESLVAKLAQEKPKTPWLNLIRFQLSVHRQDWAAAQLAVNAAQHARLLESPKAQSDTAALLLAEAVDCAKSGQNETALQKAENALRRAPHWLPAVVLLAQQQNKCGHTRSAMRLIEREWKTTQKKVLADVYRDLVAGEKNPLATVRHVEKLLKITPASPVAKQAVAEAALEAALWGEARRYLESLARSDHPTQSIFRLLARLERQENGNDHAATNWLLRITDAAADPHWSCAECGHESTEWTATCPSCGAFNKHNYR